MSEKSQITASTQQYLDVAEIHDGIIVLKDGSLRSVLAVSSINFSLKSEDEKNSIIYGFQDFLNYLNFDIQILCRSRRLDLKDYVKKIGEIAAQHTNPRLKEQTNEYIDFINSLLSVVNIMDKQFYVVIPFYPTVTQATSSLLDKLTKMIKPTETAPQVNMEDFEANKQQLNQRTNVIAGQLGGMGLRCASLNTQELIELLYMSYNPDTSKNQRLTNVDFITNNVITVENKNRTANITKEI